MYDVYYFIDGSALTAQIRQLRRTKPIYASKRLCPSLLMSHLMEVHDDLHNGAYKRATLYFPRGDEVAIEEFIRVPDYRVPGEVRDIHFKFCGHKLKKSADFDKFVEENVPSKFRDRVSKSEKGIDIEMCCDALRLASRGGLGRLILFTNDGDFIPLCRTLKDFGANVSILHLSAATSPNAELLREADSYDIVADASLGELFVEKVNQEEVRAPSSAQAGSAEKPPVSPPEKA